MQTHSESVLHHQKTFFTHIQDYLSEFVFGGIDGSVTTFAVVAGATGASLSSSVVIILGFANLFADGFSMSVGSYLSAKSERDNYEKQKRIEYWEIDHLPEQEQNEIREIFADKGFHGELLEQIVTVITSDRERWVDLMMKEELEMIPSTKPPFLMAVVTFFSFLTVGFIPIFPYVLDLVISIQKEYLFPTSCLFTSIAFALVGFLKTYVNETSRWKGIVETVFLGVSAALVAYYIGDFLENIIS
ncbi:VIT1/CCC1 transporter family protein [Xanthocytophaga agilis]|uniref:VIT1/CCC1 transporter family protein n=1 Tax=Xanthocytophaga agilis TaxID=3048010 RepID=A0AAE3R2C5_9BACT|nr:VIT1/CCC1 transporter family protein [Xanthocytophaga agilis]MDJ1500322.1 VIT1/CCC1 transporter family protein [Xanthocytophaga agilis]